MTRLAALDIGTNSILLLVAEVTKSGIVPIVDEAVITRLGKGVDRAGRLDSTAIQRSIQAIEVFAKRARSLGVERIIARGTSALRDACNADDFLYPAREILGVDTQIISGNHEARLSWTSVVADTELPVRPPIMMTDVGGGSTELVMGNQEQISLITSIDIGAVRLTERWLKSDPHTPVGLESAREHARSELQRFLNPGPVNTLVGIGGTIVNLAIIAKSGASHTDVHGVSMSLDEITNLADRMGKMTIAQRREMPGLDAGRADIIVAGALIFEALMRLLHVEEVITSTRGARYGMIWEAVKR